MVGRPCRCKKSERKCINKDVGILFKRFELFAHIN